MSETDDDFENHLPEPDLNENGLDFWKKINPTLYSSNVDFWYRVNAFRLSQIADLFIIEFNNSPTPSTKGMIRKKRLRHPLGVRASFAYLHKLANRRGNNSIHLKLDDQDYIIDEKKKPLETYVAGTYPMNGDKTRFISLDETEKKNNRGDVLYHLIIYTDNLQIKPYTPLGEDGIEKTDLLSDLLDDYNEYHPELFTIQIHFQRRRKKLLKEFKKQLKHIKKVVSSFSRDILYDNELNQIQVSIAIDERCRYDFKFATTVFIACRDPVDLIRTAQGIQATLFIHGFRVKDTFGLRALNRIINRKAFASTTIQPSKLDELMLVKRKYLPTSPISSTGRKVGTSLVTTVSENTNH